MPVAALQCGVEHGPFDTQSLSILHVIVHLAFTQMPDMPIREHGMLSPLLVWEAMPALHVSIVQSSWSSLMSASSSSSLGSPSTHFCVLQSPAVWFGLSMPSSFVCSHSPSMLHLSVVQGFLSSHCAALLHAFEP